MYESKGAIATCKVENIKIKYLYNKVYQGFFLFSYLSESSSESFPGWLRKRKLEN